MSAARSFVFHTGEGQTLSQLASGIISSPFLYTSHLSGTDKDVCTCYTQRHYQFNPWHDFED